MLPTEAPTGAGDWPDTATPTGTGSGPRRVRPVSLAINTAIPVPGQPPVHRLASHSKALGDFSYRDAIQDLQHGPVSPLDRIQLPKHCGGVASSEATAVTAGAFRAACAPL